MYQKLQSDDVRFLRHGAQQTDGQMEGQKKGHIEQQTDGWMDRRKK